MSYRNYTNFCPRYSEHFTSPRHWFVNTSLFPCNVSTISVNRPLGHSAFTSSPRTVVKASPHMHTVTTGTGVSQQALLAILMSDDALSTAVHTHTHTLRRHLQLHTLTHTENISRRTELAENTACQLNCRQVDTQCDQQVRLFHTTDKTCQNVANIQSR